MRTALVHDYLNEYGGAERVLQTLSEMWPEAPIYTAFAVPGSSAVKAFTGKKIITSWFQNIPFYNKLYSPLRFLIPWIWGSFNFSEYDLVITSASWFITKGLAPLRHKASEGLRVPLEICYCHTPPRWLYGYETSINWQKYWPVRIYSAIVGHFLRMYDFSQAQKVGVFVANSKNVAERIEKFYRREAVVIYPPVTHPAISKTSPQPRSLIQERGDYYLIVSRLVGGKGIEMAVTAARKYGFKLKIAGEFAGLNKMEGVETLGRVTDEERNKLMAEAKGFLALAKDEDFGITPVEAQMCGTAVIAFNGGGYRETVVDGKTGVLFDDYSAEGLGEAIKRFGKIKWDEKMIKKNAEKFSKENFKKQMTSLVQHSINESK